MQSAAMQKTVNLADEKRSRIVNAGTSVFLRYGYHGANLGQIADAARLPERTVLEFATCKKPVFSAVVEQMYEQSLADAKAAEALARLHSVSSSELLASIMAARIGSCSDVMLGSPHTEELEVAKDEFCGLLVLDQQTCFRDWLISVIDKELALGRMHVRSSVSTFVIADEVIEAGRSTRQEHPSLKWTDLHRRISAKVKSILAWLEP